MAVRETSRPWPLQDYPRSMAIIMMANTFVFNTRQSLSAHYLILLCFFSPQLFDASCSGATIHPPLTSSVVTQPHVSTSRPPHYSCPQPTFTSPSDSLLSRNHSSSTVESFSTDPSIEPITPPDYPVHCSSTMSPDYYESPPSPPQSLPDQMQYAYASGDMHLARMLLLKLKGVEVAGDDDPRIAAVREEDFRVFFVPEGCLQFDEAELRLFEEGDRIDRERRQRLARQERLKACARLWEDSVQEVRYEKAKVEQRREEAALQRKRSEIEAREREKQRTRSIEERDRQKYLRPLRTTASNPRTLLRYDNLLPKPQSKPCSPPESLFQYPLPPSPPRVASYPHNSSLLKDDALSLTRFKRELALQHSRTIARSVSFTDVIISMHGPLFPADEISSRKLETARSEAQVELFQSMFETSAETSDKHQVVADGKQRATTAAVAQEAHVLDRRQDPDSCMAKSQASQSSVKTVSDSTVSTSASTVTRTTSWFSFNSRKSTTSTNVTTPSTSASSVSVKSPPSTLSALPPLITSSPAPPHFHGRSSAPTLIRAVDDPLSPPLLMTSKLQSIRDPSVSSPPRGRPRTRGTHTATSPEIVAASDSDRGLVRHVSRSVFAIIDIATQLQRACVKATLFSVGADMNVYSRSRSSSRDASRTRSHSSSVHHRLSRPASYRKGNAPLKPEGYRVRTCDAAVFTSPVSSSSSLDVSHWQPQPTRNLISLINASDFRDLTTVQTYDRVFPLPPPIPRSPFRFPEPPSSQLPRPRPVANPIMLRLQALQNICAVRALRWEGRPKEGRMCAGKERMTGIAWEGIGRSNLNWEVKPAPVY